MEINNNIEIYEDKAQSNLKPLIAAFIFFVSFLVIASSTLIKYQISGVESNSLAILGTTVALALLVSALALYYFFSRASLIGNIRYLLAQMTIICLIYVISIFISLASLFLMPIFLTAYWIAPISKRRDAFLLNLLLNTMLLVSLTVECYLSRSGDYISVLIMCITGITVGTLVSYSVSYDIKRFNLIIKGLIISIIAAVITLSLSFINHQSFDEVYPNVAFVMYAAVAQLFLALIGNPIFEAIFNLVTNSRLIELTDHNMPLIKRLITEAPGTFNHSLAVANYAEVCASAIGENPYLARACAYYHDIGKIENPEYFSENQSDYNPHDELLPELSAEIIKNHTHAGFELCKKYRIPEEVASVTLQHHGTHPIAFFYNKAKQLTDGEVEIKDYSYDGKTPVTKINAIIMICDSSEATIRAMDKPNSEKVDGMVRRFIQERIQNGQFDNCDITLKDLDIIRETIKSAFGGQYHKRVKYQDHDKH